MKRYALIDKKGLLIEVTSSRVEPSGDFLDVEKTPIPDYLLSPKWEDSKWVESSKDVESIDSLRESRCKYYRRQYVHSLKTLSKNIILFRYSEIKQLNFMREDSEESMKAFSNIDAVRGLYRKFLEDFDGLEIEQKWYLAYNPGEKLREFRLESEKILGKIRSFEIDGIIEKFSD